MVKMRTFILYARKAVTSDFNLQDLGGSGGKMDTVCRFVTSAIWLSHGIRKDVIVYTILNGPPIGPVTIRWKGEMKRVDPNEYSIGMWIKKSLDLINSVGTNQISCADIKEWHRLQEGIEVSRKSFQEIIKSIGTHGANIKFYVLEEKGKDISEIKLGENSVFVVGDSIGIPKNEEKFALRYGEKISLGKTRYFASACCSVINWVLDRNK